MLKCHHPSCQFQQMCFFYLCSSAAAKLHWCILTETYICSVFIQYIAIKPVNHSSTITSVAAVMIGLSKSSLHQLSLTSHKCLFLCYFPLDFHTHITFHGDESELSLPPGALQADSVMLAAVRKPIV